MLEVSVGVIVRGGGCDRLSPAELIQAVSKQAPEAVASKQPDLCFQQVLISQRQANQSMPGVWEFPGGKFEVGETAEQALQRELHEELGISVRHMHPMQTIEQCYSDRFIKLHVFWVFDYAGEACGREGQVIRWVPLETLVDYQFPAANSEIVQRLSRNADF